MGTGHAFLRMQNLFCLEIGSHMFVSMWCVIYNKGDSERDRTYLATHAILMGVLLLKMVIDIKL